MLIVRLQPCHHRGHGLEGLCPISSVVKENICVYISESGPVVFPSTNRWAFIRKSVSFHCLYLQRLWSMPECLRWPFMAMEWSRIHSLEIWCRIVCLVIPLCWRCDSGANFNLKADGILLFSIDRIIVDGRNFTVKNDRLVIIELADAWMKVEALHNLLHKNL